MSWGARLLLSNLDDGSQRSSKQRSRTVRKEMLHKWNCIFRAWGFPRGQTVPKNHITKWTGWKDLTRKKIKYFFRKNNYRAIWRMTPTNLAQNRNTYVDTSSSKLQRVHFQCPPTMGSNNRNQPHHQRLLLLVRDACPVLSHPNFCACTIRTGTYHQNLICIVSSAHGPLSEGFSWTLLTIQVGFR